MQEIKAYVRRSCVNRVVAALQQMGAPGINVMEVHPVGYGYEPRYFEPPFGQAFSDSSRPEIVKLELVCADQDAESFIEVVLDESHTGAKGDGIVFVSDVSRAIRIRDHASGEEILARTI